MSVRLGRLLWAPSMVVATIFFLSSCACHDCGPSETAEMISRVELDDDGSFVALRQRLTLAPEYPDEGVPAGTEHGVYISTDGRTWTLTDQDADLVPWAVNRQGCVASYCLSASDDQLSGIVRTRDAEVAFEPYEPPPSCLDGWLSFGPVCENPSHAGPLDIAVDESSGVAVVALGTEGVARFEDGQWQQINVDTRRPRSSFRRNWKRDTALWVLVPFGFLAAVTFLSSRLNRRAT